MAVLKFKHDRAGDTSLLTFEITSDGTHGAIGPLGISPRVGFIQGILDAEGWAKAADGVSDYIINDAQFGVAHYRLTVKRGTLAISSMTFSPAAIDGIVDVNHLIRTGLGEFATPQQLQELADMLTLNGQLQSDLEALRVSIDSASVDMAQQQAANNEQAAQAIQQAVTVSLFEASVPTEADALARGDGSYLVQNTMQMVTVQNGQITARGPDIPTTSTSVTRLPDIPALTAYVGLATTVQVDDPQRGGMFVRASAGIAGAANEVTRIAHSNPDYVWQRQIAGAYLTSWARVPHVGGDNFAPFLQTLFDSVPRGGVVENNVRGQGLVYWPVAPWTRPDGKTDTILTIDRTVDLRWGANQYSGYIGYDTRTPGTMDVLQVSSSISTVADFAGSTTEYGMRLRDLAILPTTGQPCARHALNLVVTAQNNLADILLEGGQFVATNPEGRAVYSTNSGNNGMFTFRANDLKVRGGLHLNKLGDSCSIRRGTFAGHAGAWAVYISLLDPTNPTDTAAQLVIEEVNINALAGGVLIENAATFAIRHTNGEARNRHEGGAANYGKPFIYLRNCGNVAGIPGQSARQYGGSIVEACKALPADGATYDTSSGADGLWIENCRNLTVLGGAYGTSNILGPDNSPADSSKAIWIKGASDGIVIDMPDLQLTTNSIGIKIDNTAKNVSVRQYTPNIVGTGGQREIVDEGQGTMGIARGIQPADAYATMTGYEPLRVTKTEDGTVHLRGTLFPSTGQMDIPMYHKLVDLPAGFTPAYIARRMVGIEHRGLDNTQPTARRWAMYPARILPAADGGAVQVNSREQTDANDVAPIPQATGLSVDVSWYAPPVS